MTIVGRSKIDHPSLGTVGGSTLHAQIENIYTNIGNHLAGRYFAYSSIANSTVTTLEHNFGAQFADYKILLYTGSHPNLVRVSDPSASGWTIAATSGFEKTKIDVTAPSSGGPHTFAIFMTQGRGAEKTTDLDNVATTTPLNGQLFIYNTLTSKWEPSYLNFASETASITSNTITPTTGTTLQRITGSAADLQMIASPVAGKYFIFINETGSDIQVKNNTGATTANRIYTGTGADISLKNQASIGAIYSSGLSRWVIVGGAGSGGGTTDLVTQASHGFAVGDILYMNGATYTKAIATAANTAEVVGMVSRVVDSSTFEMTISGEVTGLSGLTAGEVYFLSTATAGAMTVTEPTTIGYVSLPLGVASSTTSFYVTLKRGNVIGGANARTQINLLNNTTGNVQDVSAYEAGELTGWVSITNTTAANSLRFYVSAPFAKNGAASNWNISPAYMGDTPPSGFSLSITSAGIIQYTMPTVSGFSAANINYALNAPAVGATFPLSVSGSNIVAGTPTVDTINEYTTANGVQIKGRTSGTAIAAGYFGEFPSGMTANAGVGGSTYRAYSTTLAGTSDTTLVSLTLNKGIYLIGFNIASAKALDATTPEFGCVLKIGGTSVSIGMNQAYTSLSGSYVSGSRTYPAIITSDSTAVTVVGSQSVAAARATFTDLWAIRIA